MPPLRPRSSRNFSPWKLYWRIVVVAIRSSQRCRVCVRYTHDCTRTVRATAVCVRHQPNEGRKVHSYCINSSLSFLSRAHLNQQKAPATQYWFVPLWFGPSTRFLPVPRPLLILHPPPARHSSTELNPPLASPKKPSSCFRATLEPTLNPGKGWCTSLLVRVPLRPLWRISH